MPILGYPPDIYRRSDGLYSMDPDKFREADAQLAEMERRQEWPLLHGDGATVGTLNKDKVPVKEQEKLGWLADESEPLKLTA